MKKLCGRGNEGENKLTAVDSIDSVYQQCNTSFSEQPRSLVKSAILTKPQRDGRVCLRECALPGKLWKSSERFMLSRLWNPGN